MDIVVVPGDCNAQPGYLVGTEADSLTYPIAPTTEIVLSAFVLARLLLVNSNCCHRNDIDSRGIIHHPHSVEPRLITPTGH